jgi:hypothetical protein
LEELLRGGAGRRWAWIHGTYLGFEHRNGVLGVVNHFAGLVSEVKTAEARLVYWCLRSNAPSD